MLPKPLLLVVPLVLAGCAAATRAPAPVPVAAWSGDARMLVIRDGASGAPLDFAALVERLADADAVIVGEQHDDAAGHAFQAALALELALHHPDFALALEMLERDDQPVLDDYLDDLIDAETLASETLSEGWGGPGGWIAWYQPIVDAAKKHERRVVAANAPRRYVRVARRLGYDRLAALPDDRRALVAWPEALDEGAYRDRFFDLAGVADREDARMTASFRSQQTWDATMADSVARAIHDGAQPVLLCVGQFHSDFEGGTILQLRARAPEARIVTISMQRRAGTVLDESDRDRADVIVYTGEGI